MKALIPFVVFILMTGVIMVNEGNSVYTSLLKEYVQDGKVRYRELCKDPRLEKYIAILKSSDAEQLSNSKDRLAFWTNAYNTYTLKVICDHYPIKSVNELHSGGLVVGSIFNTTVWDRSSW